MRNVNSTLSQLQNATAAGLTPCTADGARVEHAPPIAGATFTTADHGRWSRIEPTVKLGILAATILLVWIGLKPATHTEFLAFENEAGMRPLFRWLIGGYGVIVFASLIWRVVLWLRYRPVELVADDALPTLSVIIPAYNEGELVRHGILAAAASDYPAEKLELIVIDDGSTDDTWRHIRAAEDAIDGAVRITTIRLSGNRGKRYALDMGIQRANGEILVTTDSDSILDRMALRHVVAPLVRDHRVTCVAGCVQALNAGQNIITRFMKCYFSLSFKFVRAYQSEIDGVFCAPGALSAYRASAVRPVLREWSEQRFLGQPCATGEDRAMTNLLLREGGLTAYQQSAIVWSRVPDCYGSMARMFLRWARSNIRETIVLWKFLFTRFRVGSLSAFRLNMVLVLMSLVLSPFLIGHSLGLALVSDGFVLRYVGAMAVFSGVMAAIYWKNERDSDWIWLLAYQLFSVVGLSWIMPYAAMTLRNTKWLTRGDDVESSLLPSTLIEDRTPSLAVR